MQESVPVRQEISQNSDLEAPTTPQTQKEDMFENDLENFDSVSEGNNIIFESAVNSPKKTSGVFSCDANEQPQVQVNLPPDMFQKQAHEPPEPDLFDDHALEHKVMQNQMLQLQLAERLNSAQFISEAEAEAEAKLSFSNPDEESFTNPGQQFEPFGAQANNHNGFRKVDHYLNQEYAGG